MFNFVRAAGDVAAAVCLAAVLVGVYWVDQSGRFTPRPPVAVTTVAESAPSSAAAAVRLAVTPGGFDDMGKLLRSLGEGYRYEEIDAATLRDPERSGRYDALFLTCAEAGDAADTAALGKALRQYVERGGTLYASDLRFDSLAAAFPEFVDARAVAQGTKQDFKASVVAAPLRDVIGPEMPLHFDLDGWRPAAFDGPGVVVLIKGSFRTTAGVSSEAPLLVRFPVGNGTVLFTSFHNEKQNSESELKLLKFLVLSTVTAAVDARVARAMLSGGFSPQSRSLLSAAPGDPSVTRSYNQAHPGALQFTLGFDDRGAQLRLEVTSPSGEKTVKRGGTTLTVDIPDAAAGTWQYTAIAENLPYPNFPFTLSVGAAGATPPVALAPKTSPPPALGTRGPGIVKFREVSLERKAEPARKRIAVTPPHYDDVGKLLRSLGSGFKFDQVTYDDLRDPATLDRYDILFLTCSGLPRSWMETESSEGVREGVRRGLPKEDYVHALCDNLNRFVNRGGTLYASDLVYPMVGASFPTRPAKILHVEQLEEVEQLERAWLNQLSGGSKLQTVTEAILSTPLEGRYNAVIALVLAYNIDSAGLFGNDDEVSAKIRSAFEKHKLPIADTEVRAIREALKSRARAVLAAQPSTRGTSKSAAAARGKVALKDMLSDTRKRAFDAARTKLLSRGGHVGDRQSMTAHVVDKGLQELIGPSISLEFNEPGWNAANFSGDDITVYLRGEFKTTSGSRATAPLLVKFPEGQGTVIFTSFHNEKQNSTKEEALLRYLVFAAVNAREEALADKTMLSGGFSPAKRNVISHSSGDPTVTRTYRAAKAGTVRFALTFSGEGAQLKLTLVAPDGSKYEHDATATHVVEAIDAPAGEWTYTVTATKVPYENFPFSVGVSEQKPAPAAP